VPTPSIESPPPDPGTAYRYWGFISYSHKDDAWARRVHAALERWSVPRKLVGRATALGPAPRRLFPVFRDRDEIAGGESLDDVIRAALRTSRFLIVVCSPRSARSTYVNEEIRLFKSMGREARVIYLIVDGEPGGATDPAADPARAECFAPVARHLVGPDGTVDAERIEPVAADARPVGDGFRNAMLKVRARMLELGFDDLRRRDARRRNRVTAVLAAVNVALLAALAVTYVGLADAGLRVPLGDAIRTTLDGHEMSVFRPVPGLAQIRDAAAALERDMTRELLKHRMEDGWVNDAPLGQRPSVSVMSHGQAMAALFARPALSAGDYAALIPGTRAPFADGVRIRAGGAEWGWPSAHPPDSTTTIGFVNLWMSLGLCESIGAARARHDDAAERRLVDGLDYAQAVLRNFHRDADGGAWIAFPFPTNAKQYSVYATTMAILSLSSAHRLGLAWDGSPARRDELLRAATRWVIAQYRVFGKQRGWINDPAEERATEVFDGLTAQIFVALQEAERTGAGEPLPAAMRDDLRDYLVGLATRNIDYPTDAGELRIEYRHHDGRVAVDKETLRYLWWGWAVRGCADWLRDAGQRQLPEAHRVQVRRALAHLILKLGPQEMTKLRGMYAYAIAEDLYCVEALLRE
jgi:hypothetical protein